MAAARTLKDDNVSLTNELTHFDGLCINMQKLCFAHIVFSFFMFVQMNSESSGMSGCCGATFVVWLSFSTTWTSTASAHTARALEEHRSVSVTRCFCRCLKHRFTFIQGSTMVEATKEGTCLALREGQSLWIDMISSPKDHNVSKVLVLSKSCHTNRTRHYESPASVKVVSCVQRLWYACAKAWNCLFCRLEVSHPCSEIKMRDRARPTDT